MEEILVPFIVFASIFGVLAIYLLTRNKERMALIEKGQSANLFKTDPSKGKWLLKIGILLISVSLGILFANILVSNELLKEPVAFPSMIFMFAGIGLVASHLLSRDKKDSEE